MKITKILFEILVAYLAADLLTATAHWFEDNYIDYCTKNVLLRGIAVDNELHHYFPRTIVGYSYYENIYYGLIFSLIAIIIMCLLLGINFIFEHSLFIVVFFIFVSIANLLHRFSHERDCEKNNFVIFLQKIGILCSSEHHKVHHSSSNGEKYGILNNYTNYIYDSINLWGGLESIIYTITGIKANRKKSYSEYKDIQCYLHENALNECPDTPTKDDIEFLKKKLDQLYNCN
jgi:hypothetical protein